ncbi:MAG: hypothetical protein R3B99_33950 [Polyangiales bacterium]
MLRSATERDRRAEVFREPVGDAGLDTFEHGVVRDVEALLGDGGRERIARADRALEARFVDAEVRRNGVATRQHHRVHARDALPGERDVGLRGVVVEGHDLRRVPGREESREVTPRVDAPARCRLRDLAWGREDETMQLLGARSGETFLERVQQVARVVPFDRHGGDVHTDRRIDLRGLEQVERPVIVRARELGGGRDLRRPIVRVAVSLAALGESVLTRLGLRVVLRQQRLHVAPSRLGRGRGT